MTTAMFLEEWESELAAEAAVDDVAAPRDMRADDAPPPPRAAPPASAHVRSAEHMPSRVEVAITTLRKGGVAFRAREHYLRDDLPCQSAACTQCTHREGACLLSADATHYALLDASALRFHELLDHDLCDMVFLCSVMAAVDPLLSTRRARELEERMGDVRRRLVLLDNVHSLATHVERRRGEPRAQWERRRVVRAAQWLQEHLRGGMPVIVVSEDEATHALAREAGLLCCAWHGYLLEWRGADDALMAAYYTLAEVLAADEGEETSGGAGAHLSVRAVERGVERGELYTGTLHVDAHHHNEAYVHAAGSDVKLGAAKVFVSGSDARNRAIHGDRVAVQLLPESEWCAPSRLVRGAVDDADAMVSLGGGGSGGALRVPTGRVVAVVERHTRPYVCTVQVRRDEQLQHTGMQAVLCVPRDYRVPKIRVRTRNLAHLAGRCVLVTIDGWARGSQYPDGHYTEVLGRTLDIDVETEALLREHGITSSAPFTAGVLACLPADSPERPWTIPADEVARRRDLRATHTVFSIDPIGCVDVDDTLSVRTLPNGNVEVGVHIADVSHFVRPGTMLDAEARDRATTVYLVDRRLDMLPSLLSEKLCSLVIGADSLAVSVMWELEAGTFRVVDTWYGRTVISSSYQLAYEQAQDLADGGDGLGIAGVTQPLDGLSSREREALRRDVRLLMQVARVLRARRQACGALELESAEPQFVLDKSAKGKPLDVHQHDDDEIHHTIAEFMITANIAVAEKIFATYPSSALLRRHPSSDEDDFASVMASMATLGLTLDASSNRALSESLARATAQASDESVPLILKWLSTQAMQEAVYFSTGDVPRDQFFHFGLAVDMYTHFTSPIRRYADVLVHRMLMASLAAEPAPYTNKELVPVAEHINERNREAKYAQMESQDMFFALYFRAHPVTTDAVVYRIRRNALFVFLPAFKLRATVFLTDRDGRVMLPRGNGADDTEPELVPGAVLDVEEEDDLTTALRVRRGAGGEVLWAFALFQHITVHVSAASEAAAHLPPVRLRLVRASECHGSSEKGSAPARLNVRREAASLRAASAAAASPSSASTAFNSPFRRVDSTPYNHSGEAAAAAAAASQTSSLYAAVRALRDAELRGRASDYCETSPALTIAFEQLAL